MSRHPGRPLAAAFLLSLFLQPAIAGDRARDQPDQPGSGDPWLEEVALLITPEERAGYLTLSREYRREAFKEAFWRQRDPFPETGRNEFRETWEARKELALEELDSLDGDRGRAFLLLGPPKRILVAPCPGEMRLSEFWLYTTLQRRHRGFYLLFIRGGGGDGYRLWSPVEGLRSLLSWPSAYARTEEQLLAELRNRCPRGREAVEALESTVDWRRIEEIRPLVPTPSPEWVATFLSRSTDLPVGVETFAGTFSVGYPARHRNRTVVQAIVEVPVSELTALTTGATPVYRLRLDGEILRKDRVFESFRYRYDFAADTELPERLPIAVERLLRPGRYRLAIKVRDLGSDRFYRMESELEVPSVVEQPPAPAAVIAAAGSQPSTTPAPSAPPASPHPFAEASREARPIESHLRLLPLPDRVLTGRQRVEAIAAHPDVAKVAFLLDGRRVLTKSRPPFSVELNLGPAPRVQILEAIAFDSQGTELARDQVSINSGSQRFAVKLIEPREGQRARDNLYASATLEIPRGSELDRVEFFLNETLLTTLYQPPYRLPMRIPPSHEMAYVRVLAHLVDGNLTEDLVFINPPEHLDNIRVDFVELYTSVVDKGGKPVAGLERDSFRVFEDGVEQEILRFDTVGDLPIHAAVLLDTSTSMQDRLHEAERAALKFFERVIRPKDRASVIVFADAPELRVPLTNSLEVLAGGLSGLFAEGETALYDSLVFSLFRLAGIRGKKALILLSDGADSNSEHTQREMLDYAARSGVAVYAIGMDIDTRDIESRSALRRLARDTGGECFFIDNATQLDRIYAQIEQDLRSQYLLGYQSTGVASNDFREVEVLVSDDGLRAKTVPGYYP